jgi:sporulation protein YlmC with PRC-barrel domain
MKRFAIPAISLAALMASGVAFAETAQQPATQPSQKVEQKTQPATPAPTTTPDPSKSSVQQKTDTTATTTAPADTSNSTMAANSVNVDASKAVLATKFIGSSVYTAANENVGDINDMIFDEKGAIKAVIIGVGGFLGMGEKDVALPLDKITITKDENNAVKLTVQASKDDLEKAPAFDKTLFVVKAPASGSSTTTTTTAPSGSSSTTTQQ